MRFYALNSFTSLLKCSQFGETNGACAFFFRACTLSLSCMLWEEESVVIKVIIKHRLPSILIRLLETKYLRSLVKCRFDQWSEGGRLNVAPFWESSQTLSLSTQIRDAAENSIMCNSKWPPDWRESVQMELSEVSTIFRHWCKEETQTFPPPPPIPSHFVNLSDETYWMKATDVILIFTWVGAVLLP